MRHLKWILGLSAAFTVAALLWLWQSSNLAATGQRIFYLEGRRQSLVEHRSRLLVTYANVTSPEQLERRADALGFASAESLTYVSVDGAGDDTDVAWSIAADAPLAFVGHVRSGSASLAPGAAEQPKSGDASRAAAFAIGGGR